MRVVHVINRFGYSGGAENQLVMNLIHFSDSDIEHRVVVLFHEEDDEAGGVEFERVFLFRAGERPGRGAVLKALRAELRNCAPDLVHCTLADAALSSRIAGRLDGWPVLESLVNLSHEPVRIVDNPSVKRWKLEAHRWLDKATMRSVAHFHALTQAVAESWIDVVGLDPSKITVIPRGVDLTRFDLTDVDEPRARVRSELGLEPHHKMLLNVGRQEPQKGQRYLIESLPRILEDIPDAVLVMAGRTGNSTAALQGLIDQLALREKVIQVGVRDDIPHMLHACDVFVFPSLFEGLGVSLIEAMAARRPCVASTAPPFSEIIDHGRNGMLANVRDPSSIATCVTNILNSPDLGNRLAFAARGRVEEEYEISRTARRTEELYLSLHRSRTGLPQ